MSGSKPQSKVEIAYGAIKDDLLAGRIAQGAPLRIEMLQKVYGQGSTPLREALARLEAEGLVEQLQHRGFFATCISADDFEDLTYTRITLERALIARAIERGDDAWEGRVLTAHHFLAKTRIDLNQPDERIDLWQERHVEFHVALVSGSGAKRMISDYHRAFEHIRRHQMALALQPAVDEHLKGSARAAREVDELERRMAIDEHTGLMNAVLARDVTRSLQLLDAHLNLMPLKLLEEE